MLDYPFKLSCKCFKGEFLIESGVKAVGPYFTGTNPFHWDLGRKWLQYTVLYNSLQKHNLPSPWPMVTVKASVQ